MEVGWINRPSRGIELKQTRKENSESFTKAIPLLRLKNTESFNQVYDIKKENTA
jgi:hypothetical protein